ncbi:hypothetical protein GCM10012286_03720 [Streptomyces lasiicapitis]|uniref:Uncharacterized protein n=1 Tax=Streptomyces lasiicapitis TaxID=1923961 RepID=A0ABQ2LHY3_9ACTN|nr:hypothetical protein GCM10012286_03720 [Streptomyces lasiicapitis]
MAHANAVTIHVAVAVATPNERARSGRISTGALAPAATGAASNASQKMGTWAGRVPLSVRLPVSARVPLREPEADAVVGGVTVADAVVGGVTVAAGAVVLDTGPPEAEAAERAAG